jgi:DNA-binding LacI/PurR family transcriptional regulator
MKDIAMLAGVSRQAVSAVLNSTQNSRVSDENRKKILRIAKELNYVPNSAARSLKGGPTKTIGLLGVPFSSGLNNALYSEIADILNTFGYNLLSCQYGHGNYSAARGLTELLSRGVDGIIITNSEDRKELERNQTVPYVFCSHNNVAGFDVGVNNTQGGYIATKHLIEHGRKRICFVCAQGSIIDDVKSQGMRLALTESGLDINEDFFFSLRSLEGKTEKLLKKLTSLNADAVFCSNDFIAAKLIAVLHKNRVKVPDDIAVIGYDGYTFSQFAPVPLTTVIQQVRKQAEISVDTLMNRIKDNTLKAEPENISLTPKLHIASSCGCKLDDLDKMFTINTFTLLEKDLKMNFDITA